MPEESQPVSIINCPLFFFMMFFFAKKKCENLKIRAEASALSSFKKSTAHGIDIVYKV